MNEKRSIILSGFMGAGKTELGKALAKRLRIPFADTDLLIEERAKTRIPELFKTKTEAGFRDLEHAAILELAVCRGLVIATGGGAFEFPRNVIPLRKSGVVIFLDAAFDECYARIAGTDRPLVSGRSREELLALYHRRLPSYRAAADFTLAVTGPPEEWVDEALALIGANDA